MTYGGAGALFPIIVLLILSVPILIIWVCRGAGNFKLRRNIGVSEIVILCIAVECFFTRIGRLQNVGLLMFAAVTIVMLLTPIIFKSLVCRKNS